MLVHLVCLYTPPGLKILGQRRRLITTAPPMSMLWTNPYLPCLSDLLKSPGACIRPAPAHIISPKATGEYDTLVSTHNYEVALALLTGLAWAMLYWGRGRHYWCRNACPNLWH